MNLKQGFVVTLGLLMATSVTATPERDDMCSQFARLASAIMSARQVGIPLRDLFDTCVEHWEEPHLLKLCQSIVLEAYKRPRFITDRMQQKEADSHYESTDLSLC